MSEATFIVGDTRAVTATLPDDSVDLVLTSPPFLALRSYLPADHPDKDSEIGSEADPAAFLDVLLDLVTEWERVLTPTGSIAVELGDSYSGGAAIGGDGRDGSSRYPITRPNSTQPKTGPGWPLAKSLCLIPQLYATSLAYGRNVLNPDHTIDPWRIRNIVRWVRPNPPVGALGDKYRPATSELVIACKAKDRWFDLDAVRTNPKIDRPPAIKSGNDKQTRAGDPRGSMPIMSSHPAGAPPLDWWQIPTHPYKGAHYATWPPELCRIPIDSMCPPGGTVLDPFAGSGTTLAVATGMGRDAIGIDLDPRNADLARERVGMFLTVKETTP